MGHCGKTVKEQSFFGNIDNLSLAQPSSPRDKKSQVLIILMRPIAAVVKLSWPPSAAMGRYWLLTSGIFGSRTVRKGVVLSCLGNWRKGSGPFGLQVVSECQDFAWLPMLWLLSFLKCMTWCLISWREGEMNIHKHQRNIAVKPGFFEASIHGQRNLALCHVVPIARYLFPLLAKLPFPSLSL